MAKSKWQVSEVIQLKKYFSYSFIFASLVLLGGCSSLSVGESDFSCGMPSGVPCQSLSESYENTSVAQKKGGGRPTSLSKGASESSDEFYTSEEGFVYKRPEKVAIENSLVGFRLMNGAEKRLSPPHASFNGDEILSQGKVMRVMVFPWVDANNVLHDRSYFYFVINQPEWNIPVANDRPPVGFGRIHSVGQN
jgi:type IV conjugative transfer system lipoprotein TraV